MKRSLYIVFPDDWLPFSPTTLNLYDNLSQDWDVTILAFHAKGDEWPLSYRKVVKIKSLTGVEKFLKTIDKVVRFFRGRTFHLKRRFRALQLMFVCRRIKADAWVTVDTHAAWALQRLGRFVHLVSLELYDRDPFVKKLHADQIKSVLIQSKSRLVSLAPHVLDPVFLVQNAPVFPGPQAGNTLNERNGLVMSGSCFPEFGLNIVLKYFRMYSDRRLALHGTLFERDEVRIREEWNAEIAAGRMSLSLEYKEGKELLNYLNQFRIGFCFYDLRFEDVNNFNFWMAPSGKLFHYFAAGIPVIATDLPGFQVVREYGAGILIRDDDPRTIRRAIEEIEATYDEKVKACYKAAANFSFDRTIEPFRHYLKSGEILPDASLTVLK